MRLSCLMLLVVMSIVTLTECKPLSDDIEKAPCVDCGQKNLRRKRSYQMVFTQAAQGIKLNLGCLSCYDTTLQYTMRYIVPVNQRPDIYTMRYIVPVNRRPDIYIGNGQNNVNHVIVNGANNVYIGNGAHNTNYVSYG